MFRTPTIEHGRGSRRTLQMNSGSAAGRLIRGIEDEQSDISETGMGNNGDGEMLTILRNLQQQVSEHSKVLQIRPLQALILRAPLFKRRRNCLKLLW